MQEGALRHRAWQGLATPSRLCVPARDRLQKARCTTGGAMRLMQALPIDRSPTASVWLQRPPALLPSSTLHYIRFHAVRQDAVPCRLVPGMPHQSECSADLKK